MRTYTLTSVNAAQKTKSEAPAATNGRPFLETAMDYLGPGDLLKRWSYTRAGIHKLSRKDDFPKLVMVINAGRTKVWARADIEAYEKAHPEVLEAEGGIAKQRGYFLCLLRNKSEALVGAAVESGCDNLSLEVVSKSG